MKNTRAHPRAQKKRSLLSLTGSLLIMVSLVVGLQVDAAARDPLFASTHPSTLSIMALDKRLMLNFVCTKATGFKQYLSIGRSLIEQPETGDVVVLLYQSKDGKNTSVDGLRIYQIEDAFVNADPNLPQPAASRLADVRLSWLQFEQGFNVAYVGSFDGPESANEYQTKLQELLKSIHGRGLSSSEFKMESQASKDKYNSFVTYCNETIEPPSAKPLLSKPRD